MDNIFETNSCSWLSFFGGIRTMQYCIAMCVGIIIIYLIKQMSQDCRTTWRLGYTSTWFSSQAGRWTELSYVACEHVSLQPLPASPFTLLGTNFWALWCLFISRFSAVAKALWFFDKTENHHQQLPTWLPTQVGAGKALGRSVCSLSYRVSLRIPFYLHHE